MKLRIIAVLLSPLCFAVAQQPAPGKDIFETRCSACHGGDASGTDRAPSLITYVRYHTDVELSGVIREGRKDRGMPSFALAESDLGSLIAHLRSASGTNPAMATAGLTGENRKLPSAKAPVSGARTGSLPLTDGRNLVGTILSQGDYSTVIRTTATEFHFLTREGDQWREKPVKPDANWTTYHGDISGNRYSSLEQINTGTVGDLVITGVSGGEEGARGFVDAYRATTGERVWRFNVIPKRGEKGSETWIGNALEHGCGATWLTGSYDPVLDLVYWQTGNPCPDFNGDERKGDNLYTSSVVALAAKTGELKWHFQFTPHDLHDWDATEPILLVDQPWKGEPRKLILHANRNGFFFVLDRTNGELLLAEPFVKVNWATGYGKNGRPILTENFEPTSEGTLICPASSGGTNWPADSWSPITKLFYVRATEWCAIYRKQADPLVDNRWMGGLAPNQPGVYPFIRALDINTGKKVWEYPFTGNGRGGLISTAGGIVLFGSSEGAVVALDANSGKSLWHFSAGQNWQASPMTYMVGGKQYFALPGPSGVLAFALPD